MRMVFLIAAMLASLPATSQERKPDWEEWRKCVLASAYLLAYSSSETADIIVQGAFGECADEERLFRSKIPSDLVADVYPQIRRQVTEQAIAYVLRSRQGKPSRPAQ